MNKISKKLKPKLILKLMYLSICGTKSFFTESHEIIRVGKKLSRQTDRRTGGCTNGSFSSGHKVKTLPIGKKIIKDTYAS